MVTLRIKVYLNSQADKPLYVRCVEVPDTIRIPYESLVSDLKFLYGASSVIDFELS
jgi:hypothetical protein